MSADTSRKQKINSSGQVVLPQPVNNPSIIESVAGFIHEVVPQAYSSVLPGDSRESITWAKFEYCDFNEPDNYPDSTECESDAIPPILLVLGYGSGVQVWSISGTGEAAEVLSWSQGTVKTLRLLYNPKDDSQDPYKSKRPLVAIVDSAGPGPQFCTLNFISLKTAEVVKSIKFKNPVCDVLCNKKSIVVTFAERIAVFDVTTLEDRLTITTCYLSPGVTPNSVALGPRWLAYADKRLITWQRSSGGCEGEGAQSYTATVIHAAKSLGKGLRDLSGSLTGSAPQPAPNNSAQPGIVTIVDIETKPSKEESAENVIAHFVGHVGPIVAMTFDPSGMLLVTADKHGHRFHVFRIHPHPCGPALAAVHHLYILHRGDTTARVQDIAVSWDSRWIAVSSVRGTTHVFPITPYGGPVAVRTHTTPHVVNRLSRFERSAGLTDGRGSPVADGPCTPANPRLPPYPHPTSLSPLAQLRRWASHLPPVTEESTVKLAACFGQPRAWIPGQPRGKRPLIESLFVMASHGNLIQYDLDPRCVAGVTKDKISYDTGIELGVEAKAEWVLLRPPYSNAIQPPLSPESPLLYRPPRPEAPPRPTEERWLSQVEIVTHTGPHRRLWMGPQFTFKTIDPLPPGAPETTEKEIESQPARSSPMNMPHRPYLLIESGSGGSVDSPNLASFPDDGDDSVHRESKMREDLADAMMDMSHATGIAGGGRTNQEASGGVVERQVNPMGTVVTLSPPRPQTHQRTFTFPQVGKTEPSSLPERVSTAFQVPTEPVEVKAIVEETKAKGKKKRSERKSGGEEKPCAAIEPLITKPVVEVKVEVEVPKVEKKKPKKPLRKDSPQISQPPDIETLEILASELSIDPLNDDVNGNLPPSLPVVDEEAKSPEREGSSSGVESCSFDLGTSPEGSVREPEPQPEEIIEDTEKPAEPEVEPPVKALDDDNVEDSTTDPEPNQEPKRGRKEKLKKSLEAKPREKMKSPSPVKSDPKDTDSSDEATFKSPDPKLPLPRTSKRKKPKKLEEDGSQTCMEESIVEPAPLTKSKSEEALDVEKSDYETCSEKKSDSSIESFLNFEKKPDPKPPAPSWSSIVKKSEEPPKSSSVEDKDSVYESCNDEEAPPEAKGEKTESSSSNSEEKPEATEKDEQQSPVTYLSKKARKQKRKKR